MDKYLNVFVKVVEKENFSKVASELHMYAAGGESVY